MKERVNNFVRKSLAFAVGTFPVIVAVKECFVDFVVCQGPSMQPTINPEPDSNTLSKYYFSRFRFSDVVMLDKFTPKHGNFVRGSVVMLRSIEDPNRLILKRLVAMDGDWIVSKVCIF